MDEFKNKFEFQSTLPRGERRRVSAGKSARNYFNPRSREGSDRIPRRKDKRRLHFNPRSREGSDLFTIRRILITSFQSTLPRGERPLTQSVPTWSAVFQSTLPRGERRGCVGIVLKHNDFNPRSREGSDFEEVASGEKTFISIHAPARGATPRHVQPSHLSQYFNPRSREGSDRFSSASNRYFISISIHAPARGATTQQVF